jgi:hypothetical protein
MQPKNEEATTTENPPPEPNIDMSVLIGGPGIGFNPEDATTKNPSPGATYGMWNRGLERFVTPPTACRYATPEQLLAMETRGNFRRLPGPQTTPSGSDADGESSPEEQAGLVWDFSRVTLYKARKVPRDPIPSIAELQAFFPRHPDPPDPRESLPFKPTFHPSKGLSAAYQDLLRKTRAAAAEDRRESFFGTGPIPPPTLPPPDPTLEESVNHLKPFSYVPPPREFNEREARLRESYKEWNRRPVPFIPSPIEPEHLINLAPFITETQEEKEARIRRQQEEHDRQMAASQQDSRARPSSSKPHHKKGIGELSV